MSVSLDLLVLFVLVKLAKLAFTMLASLTSLALLVNLVSRVSTVSINNQHIALLASFAALPANRQRYHNSQSYVKSKHSHYNVSTTFYKWYATLIKL